MVRWVATLGLGSALCLLLAACGSEPAPRASEEPAHDAPITPGSPGGTGHGRETDGVVPQVLDFEAPVLGGGSLRGESLAGRDVAFWFWAPW